MSERQIRLFAAKGRCERYPFLDRYDWEQAVRQLEAGESLADVNRRLRDWNHEARRVSRCESAEARRIDDMYYS